jgi:predicted nucleic acid-binding protein
MAEYYADSSVLVKRHVHEAGSAWFQALTDPAISNIVITARISIVEVVSALNRRVREANISSNDYSDLVTDFLDTCTTEYELVELTEAVVAQARQLLERHTLRAYDAVQLASALIAQQSLLSAGLPTLTFLAADDRLVHAAQAEGLPTDNPLLYP